MLHSFIRKILVLFIFLPLTSQAELKTKEINAILDSYVVNGIKGGQRVDDIQSLPEGPRDKYRSWDKKGQLDVKELFVFKVKVRVERGGWSRIFVTYAVFWGQSDQVKLLSVYDADGDFLFNGKFIEGVRELIILRKANIKPLLYQDEIDRIKEMLTDPEIYGTLKLKEVDLKNLSGSARTKYFKLTSYVKKEKINRELLKVKATVLNGQEVILILLNNPKSNTGFMSVYTREGHFIANYEDEYVMQNAKWTYCRHGLERVK